MAFSFFTFREQSESKSEACKYIVRRQYICCFSLAAFNICSLCLIFVNLITMCLGVFRLGFILFGTLWVSWTWVIISFPILGKFSTIISSSIFSWSDNTFIAQPPAAHHLPPNRLAFSSTRTGTVEVGKLFFFGEKSQRIESIMISVVPSAHGSVEVRPPFPF